MIFDSVGEICAPVSPAFPTAMMPDGLRSALNSKLQSQARIPICSRQSGDEAEMTGNSSPALAVAVSTAARSRLSTPRDISPHRHQHEGARSGRQALKTLPLTPFSGACGNSRAVQPPEEIASRRSSAPVQFFHCWASHRPQARRLSLSFTLARVAPRSFT